MTSSGNDMIYENMGTCKYLNAETQPASDMLRSCIGKSSEQIAPCHKFNHKLHMRVLDRPQDNTYFTQNTEKKEELKGPHKALVEGFANYDPGEFTIMAGECPESYLKDAYGGCTKVCKNCKVNNGGKSFEFNEFDPCFPNGVYDGIDNYGNIQCTCGKNNQYCPDKKISLYDMFTTDGIMVLDGSAITVGDYDDKFNVSFY